MTFAKISAAALMAASLAGAAAGAADKPLPQPKALTDLLGCRSIADRDARLACFDSRAAEVDTAVAKKDIFVTDRTEIRKARRSLFGLTLPDLSIFGDGKDDRTAKAEKEEEGVTRLESRLARASKSPNGHWLFVLEDGAKWVQIDPRQIPRDPRAGMPIVIRRAAMGSFLANVDGQIAVRVRREN